MSLKTFIAIAQIAVSAIVILLVLLQERGTDAGGLFGGGGGSGFYQTRRGIEKVVFVATIVAIAIFALLAIANLLF